MMDLIGYGKINMYKAPKLYLPVFSLVNLFLSRMSSHLPKQELCKVDFMNKTVLDYNFHTYVSTPSSAIVVHFLYLLDLLFKRLKDILQFFFNFWVNSSIKIDS